MGWGQRRDRSQEIANMAFKNVAGDENKPGCVIAVRPGCKFHGRMRKMLNHLYDHRPLAAGDIQETLDPQEVGPAQGCERFHRAGEGMPGKRFVLGNEKT